MLLPSAPLIGLDVGSGLIKAVTLRRKGTRVVVDRAGLMAMAGGALAGRKFLDPPAIADTVRRLCKDLRMHGRRLAVAVAGEEVFHARLKVERAALGALDELVRQELARLAPFSPADSIVDYQVLDSFAHSQWVDAVAVAATKSSVERLRNMLDRAGRTAAIVDSTACALANVFEFNYQPVSNEITALLHLGAATLTVCILRGATPLLVRDLTLEGDKPWREQEGSTERVAVEVERAFEQMDEIADDHPLEPRSRQISRLLLSGGGIRLRGLEQTLRTRLHLPMEELNPFHRIDFTGTDSLSRLVWDHVHCMPVAVGLALRGVDTPARPENGNGRP
jgi:type IV pilus assembly protein PilM